MTWLSVDLPEPFGPMMAWTSPLFTTSESPWRISRSSTRTCRFFTSSNGITFFRFIAHWAAPVAASEDGVETFFLLILRIGDLGPSQNEVLSGASLQRDRDQLLRLDRELHRQLLQHVLDEAVDNEADRFLLR